MRLLFLLRYKKKHSLCDVCVFHKITVNMRVIN